MVPELRQACLTAVEAALDADPGAVAVVGVGDRTTEWDPRSRLDLSVFAPALRQRNDAADAPSLPASLGLGSMLLDQAGYGGPRALQSVTQAEPAQQCAALGVRIAGLTGRVALLVMADGSARRTVKAPGYLDARSAAFDNEIERAIRECDLEALLRLDVDLAADLMVTGRPALQILAGAARGLRAASQIRYRDDPFGVFYLGASLTFG